MLDAAVCTIFAEQCCQQIQIDKQINNNNWLHVPAQVLGVCGPSPASPGWLVLSVTVGAFDVQPLRVRQDNVIPDLSRPTWRV